MEDTDAPRTSALLHIAAAAVLLIAGALGGSTVAMAAGGLALLLTAAGQFMHERAWVKAGQAVPIS